MIYIISRFKSTYKELKHVLKNGVVDSTRVLSLPIRN